MTVKETRQLAHAMGLETKPAPVRKPARDPLVVKMEQAYRGSRQYELDKLLRKQSLYRRRLTLAQSGLEKTQQEIYELLHGLAESRLAEKKEL